MFERDVLCLCCLLEMMSSLSKESWKSGTNVSLVVWFYKTQCSLHVDIGETYLKIKKNLNSSAGSCETNLI